ncbi:MAG: hypothetical protein RR909_04340 [Bacilli bacterium]
MPLDNSYLLGSKGFSFIKKVMETNFEESVILINEELDLKHHGWFTIKYEYLPKKYFITIEGEFNTFNIRIVNKDEGFIALKQLVDYENNLSTEDITSSIIKMKDNIDNIINFYKLIDDKLFQQDGGKYKRVKGW